MEPGQRTFAKAWDQESAPYQRRGLGSANFACSAAITVAGGRPGVGLHRLRWQKLVSQIDPFSEPDDDFMPDDPVDSVCTFTISSCSSCPKI